MFYNDYNLAIAYKIYVEAPPTEDSKWAVQADFIGKTVILQVYKTSASANRAKNDFQRRARD